MTGHGWLDMAIAAILFVASHSLPARPSLRRRLVGALGETAYLALYSLVSLLALGWLIVAAGRAPYVEVWAFAPWQLWVPNLAMPVACLLLAFGVATPSPLSFGGRAHQEFDPDKPGIAGITRHPLLWALALWSASHLPPNGNLAHVLLFGGFAVFALLGMVAMDRRFKRTLGKAEWERLARRTSLVPFAALADGRWRPAGVRIDAGSWCASSPAPLFTWRFYTRMSWWWVSHRFRAGRPERNLAGSAAPLASDVTSVGSASGCPSQARRRAYVRSVGALPVTNHYNFYPSSTQAHERLRRAEC